MLREKGGIAGKPGKREEARSAWKRGVRCGGEGGRTNWRPRDYSESGGKKVKANPHTLIRRTRMKIKNKAKRGHMGTSVNHYMF